MTYQKLIYLTLLLLSSIFSFSQSGLYLQIEKINSSEVIKIPVGSHVVFKASKYSQKWQKGIIKKIDYEGDLIIFDHTFVSLDEIEKIKIRNFGGEAAGVMLQGFGAGWLGFMVLADVADSGPEKNINKRNTIIGASAMATGWLLRKTTGNKVYTNGKTHRFRLIDTRFGVGTEE